MKVSRGLLDFLLGLGKSSVPDEFVVMLRGEGGVLTEALLPPDTEANEFQVFYAEESLPIDVSVAGTAHSHPGGALRPSDEDLSMFRSRGVIHIIVGTPFGPDDWRAFDRSGREVGLKVVDVGLDEKWLEELGRVEDFAEDLL
ncbi:MAG: putative metalloprotease [Methanonatronarchaeales archaeon]|nr:putative metalloprotease [Methanonatronarchaeales archaeon]